MRLRLSRGTSETFNQLVPIAFRAFEGDPFTPIFFGYDSPANRKYARDAWLKDEPKMNSHWVIAEDLDQEEIDVEGIGLNEHANGQEKPSRKKQKRIVGASNWRIQPIKVPYEEKDLEKEDREAQDKADDNFVYLDSRQERVDAAKIFTEYIRGRRIQCQEPHVLCLMLFVDPEYQRKGVGKMLMDWGIEVAEKLWLHVWLEASKPGEKLYRSLGFQETSRRIWQTESFGECDSLSMRRTTEFTEAEWIVDAKK